MYLSSDLVVAVKRRAAVPTAQNTFQNSDFYSLADEEIRSKLVPLVMKNMEEFYVRPLDYQINANQSSYLIPTRSVASGLRDVQIIDSNDDQNRFPLERIDLGDLYSSFAANYRFTIRKNGFYPQGNSIIIYPTPTMTVNLLRMYYVCRPNSIVDVTACAQVTGINTALNQISVTSLPSTFSTSSPLDFVKANPGFECSAIDQTPTLIAGTVLTFGSALPTDLSIGDYLCLAGQSCVVQVPVELQPLLYQYIVVRILSAQTDTQALQSAINELKVLEENAQLMIAPRVAGKSKRVVNARAINRWV